MQALIDLIKDIRSSLNAHQLSAKTSGNATLYRLSLATRTALSARAHRKLPGENYEITPSGRLAAPSTAPVADLHK